MPHPSQVYLIQEDEAGRRRLSVRINRAGHEVKDFRSTRAFIEMAPVLAAGCILVVAVDAALPPPNELSAQRSDLPVIVLSASRGDVPLAVRMIKAGACDFLETSCSDEDLLVALAAALTGLRTSDEHERAIAFTAARIADMSVREREVLQHLLAGGTNKIIAKALGISPRTVEIHRAHVMERLGAHSLSQAVRMASAAGLALPEEGSMPDVRAVP